MIRRYICKELKSLLNIMPVVLITGARQTGKTTLIEEIAEEQNLPLFTFDEATTLSNAQRDPAGWLSGLPKPLILDEVQRVPEIFLAIKRDVDLHREPGRYLLTGSANPLLLPRIGDSLAGRMGSVTLFPFSQGEILGRKERFIENLFSEELPFDAISPLQQERTHQLFLRGGFPPVQFFDDLEDVRRWVRSYLQAMMERDIRELSNIEGLREFPRLFRLLATRSGSLFNVSDIARSLGMGNVTVNRYLRLLEILYFIHLLPAWYSNRGKRLIKSPKLHLCDTAILAQLLEVDSKRLQEDPHLSGQFLENFVLSELLKQKSWSDVPVEIYHFRDGDYEVDFVLEKPDRTLIGIEVKSARTIRPDDLRGLKHLQSLAHPHFHRGIILYQGDRIESLGNRLWAVPLQALWQI